MKFQRFSFCGVVLLSILMSVPAKAALMAYVNFSPGATTTQSIGGNTWNLWNPGDNLDLVDPTTMADTGISIPIRVQRSIRAS